MHIDITIRELPMHTALAVMDLLTGEKIDKSTKTKQTGEPETNKKNVKNSEIEKETQPKKERGKKLKYEDVRKVAAAFVDDYGVPKLKKILTKFDTGSVKTLIEKDYRAFISACQKPQKAKE